MNLHFVYPDVETAAAHDIQIGIASISAVLKSGGHRVSLSHITKFGSKSEIIREMKKYSPDVFCFSSTTNQFPFVKQISRWIKEEFDAPIIVGGIHATLSPQEVISCKSIDVVCIGEGEYPLLELVNNIDDGKPIDKIKNLWVKKGLNIIENPVRPLISNLDSLPFPDYELFDIQRVLKETEGRISILVGRGCPYTCTYCCNHALRKIYEGKGSYVRYRSVDNVFQQIEYLKNRYAISRIDFSDDTFTLSRNWIKEFTEKYSKRFGLGFTCNARIETINSELLRMLKNANCQVINYGIESGNEWLRKEILKRGTASNQDIIHVFKETRDTGIKTFSYNMIGLPFETHEMIEETIALNRKISPSYIMVFIFYPYPGTELWKICRENNFLTGDFSTSYAKPGSMLNLPNWKKEEILKYYDKFNKIAMETWVKSDYPNLLPLYKMLTFALGGSRTREMLTKLKYNNSLRSIFRWGSKRESLLP